MIKDGTDLVGAFYPMAQANWFVDKAYTTGKLTGESDAKKLEMEIGLRHENLRACATFVYSNGVGGNSYALEAVRVGRQKLGGYPDESETTLFGPKMGVVDVSPQLSGPADKPASSEPSSSEDEKNLVTLCMHGGLAIAAPALIDTTKINREVTMCWSTPSTEGVAWDGKDRIIPALHYRASRVFKGVTDDIQMLSIVESSPQ